MHKNIFERKKMSRKRFFQRRNYMNETKKKQKIKQKIENKKLDKNIRRLKLMA